MHTHARGRTQKHTHTYMRAHTQANTHKHTRTSTHATNARTYIKKTHKKKIERRVATENGSEASNFGEALGTIFNVRGDYGSLGEGTSLALKTAWMNR